MPGSALRREFKCKSCPSVFQSAGKRSVHVRRCHQAQTTCEFHSGRSTGIVIETHTVARREGVFRCPRCPKSFGDPYCLRRHTKMCFPRPTTIFSKQVAISDRPGLEGPLNDLGLLYDAKNGILVCASCRYGIYSATEQVLGHLSRKHGHNMTATSLRDRLQRLDFASDEDLTLFLNPRSELIAPLEHIPVQDGFTCNICVHFVAERKSILKHFSGVHAGTTANFSPCKVQTLYKGPRQKYFGVTAGEIPRPSNGVDYVNRAVDAYVSKQNFVPPADVRHLSAFAQTFRWHEILKARCSSDIKTITEAMKFDRECMLTQQLYPVVCTYWQIGEQLIGTQEFLLEQILSSNGVEISTSSSFSRLQTSGERYCRVLMSLLLMIHWQHNHSAAIPDIIYTNNLLMNMRTLLNTATSRPDESTMSFGELTQSPKRVDELAALHSTLESIYHFDVNDEHAPSSFLTFPTQRFLVLNSVKGFETDSEGFVKICDPVDITSLVAILKYWAKHTTLMALYKRNWGVEATPGNEITASHAKSLRRYLQDGERTPFGALQDVMRFGSSIVMAPEQKGMPQLAWLTSTKASLGGVIVSLADLTSMVARLIEKMRSTLHAEILKGFPLTQMESHMQDTTTTLYDDFQKKQLGYSFLDDPNNPWQRLQLDLVRYLLRTFRREFVKCTRGDDIELDIERVRQWCKSVDEMTKLWIALVHITAGQPSRGSELTAMLIRNSVAGERNVYLHGRQIMLVQRYHKGTSKTKQHRLLARFLPTPLTLDFMAYLVYVRPALEFFLAYFPFGKLESRRVDQTQHCHYYLWATHEHGKFKEEAINTVINNSFLHANLAITVRTYRHFAIALKDRFLKSDTQTSDLYDLQAAHSTQIASTLYSRSTTDPTFMSRDDMYEFLRCSDEWHKLIGLPRRYDDSTATSSGVQARAVMSSCPDAINAGNFRHTENPSQLSTATYSATRRPQLSATIAIPVPVLVPHFRQETIEEAQARLSPEDFIDAHEHLKRFLADTNASYKSTEQSVGATLVLQGITNLLVVLPTNGGKSLLYQLPAFVDPSRCVVVVIPLVALMIESIEKCTSRGIRCTSYQPLMNPHIEVYPLLFVSVDHLAHQAFKNYLQVLNARKLLKRIYFDEAHLAVTAETYRSCMASVKMLAVNPVQKVLLTATLPPSWEPDLVGAFGFPFATLRLPTIRPNLSYIVQKVEAFAQMQQAVIDVVNENMLHPSKGIIFVMTKREVDEIVMLLLNQTTHDVAHYHSALELNERRAQLDKWKSNKVNWIVATSGLGQGVDYSQVRVVVHFGLSHNLVNYAQETGRSGRDGMPARCVTIYSDYYCNLFVSRLSKASTEHQTASRANRSSLRDLSEIVKFLSSNSQCRRQFLQTVMDGSGYPCTVDASNQACDICRQRRLETPSCTPSAVVGDYQIVAQAEQATGDQLDDGIVHNTLKGFLFHDTTTFCRVCWITNKTSTPSHKPAQCPFRQNCCFRCLGNHQASSCPNPLKFQLRSCYICGIPLADTPERPSLHYGSHAGPRCFSKARDVMIPGVWRFYRHNKLNTLPKSSEEVQLKSLSEHEFSRWLVQTGPSGTQTNLCRLWARLLMQ